MNRHALLGVALMLVLAATAWLAMQPVPEVVTAVATRAAQPERSARPAASVGWAAPPPQALAAWAGQDEPSAATPPLAAAEEAAAPPAPAPVPVPVSVPADAPPPPGRWIGRLDDAAGRAALIEGPASSRLVREQEVLDGQWRLERIADDRLLWRWLPGDLVREQSRT